MKPLGVREGSSMPQRADLQLFLGEDGAGTEDNRNRLRLKEDEKRFIRSTQSSFHSRQEAAELGVEVVRGDALRAVTTATAKTTPWKWATGTATSEHRAAGHALRLPRPGTFRGVVASSAFCYQRVLSSGCWPGLGGHPRGRLGTACAPQGGGGKVLHQ